MCPALRCGRCISLCVAQERALEEPSILYWVGEILLSCHLFVESTTRMSRTTGSGGALNPGKNTLKGEPLVHIGPERPHGPSPYANFRRNRVWLSVTDLVQPSWCELSYDYSLRSNSNSSPEKRGTGFRSASGKWIRIDKAIAEQHYRVTRRGRSMHKTLERQASLRRADVHLPQALGKLRLVQMLEALDTLKETGLCREIPVLGLIDDNVIHGQIDNLALKPSLRVDTETKIEVMPGPPSQRKRKAAFILREQAKKARMPSTESQDTPQALSVAADNEAEPLASRATNALACSSPHRYAIHLSDTKTRTTPDIPPDEDALAHRFQLMLYHRLLSSLMTRPFGTGDSSERATTTSQPLDFAAVWRKLSLNPRRPFSDTFIRGARRLLDRAARSPTQGDVSHTTPSGSAEHRYLALDCLDDLAAAWQKAVERLDVDGIDTTLTLEYILQTTDKPDGLYPASLSQSQETRPSVDAEVVEGISQVSGDTVIGLSQDSEATAVGDGDEKATMGASASNSDDKAQLVAGMLGVKEFVMDDQMLDDHLRSILQYWHGHRQPKGVPAGLERRCEVCEYHQDCEWRDTEASF